MALHPQNEWLERSNAETLHHIERQGRTEIGLTPFLGAGISLPFGFKNWSDLLRDASPPSLKPKIELLLNKSKYEEAAEDLLQCLGPDGFQNMVATSAGISNYNPKKLETGTVALLPQLASGPVVTTNFDRVLELAFEVQSKPFESVVSGPRPDLIVDALHGNRRVLIKLHGDWQDRVGRTFAKSDYDVNYGSDRYLSSSESEAGAMPNAPAAKRELLNAIESLLFSSRPMLFIGASLDVDRTVKVLMDVHRSTAGVRHFAIMKAPDVERQFEELQARLRNCGILPLWYHAITREEHSVEVERLANLIIERISVKTIDVPKGEKKSKPISATSPKTTKISQKLQTHFQRVSQLVHDGRITFVLGSAVHVANKVDGPRILQ